LATIFKVFSCNRSDERFIGDPVDYVIFDGYTKVRKESKTSNNSFLVDVKTGDADLTCEQRRIKQEIEIKVKSQKIDYEHEG